MCDECTQWRTAYLASLTAPQRTALRALADLSHGYGNVADSDGWVRTGLLLNALGVADYDALLTVPSPVVERLEAYGTVSGFRLPPFGAAVVAALAQQEGK